MDDSPLFPIAPVLGYFGVTCAEGYGWRAVKCPFHKDTDASASVNTTDQLFKCHACGISGRAEHVLMQHEGLTFGDAVKRAAEISGGGYDALPQASAGSRRVSARSGYRSGLRKAKRPGRRTRSDGGA